MCLISIAPKGTIKTKKALESFIRNGMSSNTDGSGFAAKQGNVIILEKGFRNAEKMADAIAALNLTEEDELIMHHRIGTSGERNDVNMHPFLLSNDLGVLTSIKGTFNIPVMAHNGVFGAFSDYKSKYSDTFHFVEYFVSSPQITDLLKNDQEKFEEVFKPILGGNRLAFLFPDRDLIKIGSYTEDEGYFHSNTGYKRYTNDIGGSSWNKNNNKHASSKNKRNDRELTVRDFTFDYGEEGIEPTCNIPGSKLLKTPKSNTDTFLQEMNKEIALFPNQNANKVLEQNLMFKGEDITITKENFANFIFVPKLHTASGAERNKGYVIEDYSDEPGFKTPIGRFNAEGPILYVSINDFKLMCNVYIKASLRKQYEGLKNLIDFTNRNHGNKVVKKLREILTKNFNNLYFTVRWKNIGGVFYEDMEAIYNKYKIMKKDEELPIGEAIEGEDTYDTKKVMESFTINEFAE